jgi:hypothetical protein
MNYPEETELRVPDSSTKCIHSKSPLFKSPFEGSAISLCAFKKYVISWSPFKNYAISRITTSRFILGAYLPRCFCAAFTFCLPFGFCDYFIHSIINGVSVCSYVNLVPATMATLLENRADPNCQEAVKQLLCSSGASKLSWW